MLNGYEQVFTGYERDGARYLLGYAQVLTGYEQLLIAYECDRTRYSMGINR